ncbi:MAG TPA: hypothetical protein VNT25_04300 [Allosphingosinicella sp.]|nr:hypothetical protein [Allosphingosinicella sp.]
MNKYSVAAALGGALLTAALPSGAAAQTWTPTGAEITGHAVRVEANGQTNTVHFDPGGTARIEGANGQWVQGNWFVENQMLCLQTPTARECWPYRTAFQAGQSVDLTSTCAVTSRWMPISTQPQPTMRRQGERG